MHVSVRTLYGLRALTLLPEPDNSESAHARELAEELDMSKDYLNQILGRLRDAKIVRSKKGPKGGFRLDRPSDQISLGEVLRVLEGPTLFSACTKPEYSDCEIIEECSTQSILAGVSRKILNYLDQVTIKEIREEQKSFPPLEPTC